MRNFKLFGILVFATFVAACSPNTGNLMPAPGAQPVQIQSDPLTTMPVWRHTLAKSKFKPGKLLSAVRDDIHHAKVTTGDQGVYVETDNGWATAIPAATATVLSRPPLDVKSHRAAALAYFKSTGFTLDQTNPSQIYEGTTISGTGNPSDPQTLVRVYTHIPRYLDNGTIVADSVAWVSLDSDGDVVSESVYWPNIPTEVVTQARQLNAMNGDPAARAAFTSKALTTLSAKGAVDMSTATGEVVIHHTTLDSTDLNPSAFASFDVHTGSSVHHFLVDGTEKQ